jgi:hypothetical protein
MNWDGELGLSPELQAMVLASVLTLAEAWQLQDLYLTTWEEVVEVPSHLRHLSDRMELFELPLHVMH